MAKPDEPTKDGPTPQRIDKGGLAYLIEAGPGEKGTVGHFRANTDSILHQLYERGTLQYEQYLAGCHFETIWNISGLGGRAQRGRMERTDGFSPVTPERIYDARQELFQCRWWLGNTNSKLVERVIGEGRKFAEAARLTEGDGVGYERFSADTARRKFQKAMLVLAIRWGYSKNRLIPARF